MPTRAHPRACGEHAARFSAPDRPPGSSPRLRGARRTRRCACTRTGAHPRACGEHRKQLERGEVSEGSSPRLRGAPPPLPAGLLPRRLIPAPAGSTPPGPTSPPSTGAHPRACGEHEPGNESVEGVGGSSPRLRGAPKWRMIGVVCLWLIPAPAGSTSTPLRTSPALRAHPRACGEHQDAERDGYRRGGSSPRLRGALPADRPRGAADGLIPAPAGSTLYRLAGQARPRAHPRACGEHQSRIDQLLRVLGSSPRLRGARHARRHPCLRRGLIPAPAGSTRTGPSRPAREGAHPRACGEHQEIPAHAGVITGSSPRLRGARRSVGVHAGEGGLIPAPAGSTVDGDARSVAVAGSSPRLRGALIQAVAVAGDLGLIPAPAGSTATGNGWTTRPWAHPRACGEHVYGLSVGVGLTGSSPRLRGARLPSPCAPRPPRLIPAPAGSTWCSAPGGSRARAHPRACGEHTPPLRWARRNKGSSPRLRGAR